MRKPGFKMDGTSTAIIRCAQPGRNGNNPPWQRGGSRLAVWHDWLECVLAGTASGEAEMRLRDSDVWHAVTATPAEARDALLEAGRAGRMAVVRAERVRRTRTAKGWSVFGVLESTEEQTDARH